MTRADPRYICLGRRGAARPGKGGHDDALASHFSGPPLPAAGRSTPVRPQDPPPAHPAGRRGAKLRSGAALSARNRLRRVLRAPPAAEDAVPRQPVAPRHHLVVRRAELLDRTPQAALPPLRARPRPLRRRPRPRRLEGRGRALQARPARRRPPARRTAQTPGIPPAVLGASPRGGRPHRPQPDAAALRRRSLADDRPSWLPRRLAPSRPPRGRARPRARPRPPPPPRDPAPQRTPARHQKRRTGRAQKRTARRAPDGRRRRHFSAAAPAPAASWRGPRRSRGPWQSGAARKTPAARSWIATPPSGGSR